jgi:FAD-dependent oxidoreductase domain-containing protein 1
MGFWRDSLRTVPYDVLVIGAGILGLSIAYHIKKNNPEEEVILVDRFGAVAQGNTARSNAMFRNTFTSIDNITLSDTSINYYLETQRSGIDLGLKKCGYLWLMSERQLSSNSANVRKLEREVEVRQYSKEDLKKLLPSLRTEISNGEEAQLMGLEDVASGIFGIKCGRLDPVKLSNHYRDSFLALGGKLALNTNVVSLIVEPEVSLGIEGEPFVWQSSRVVGARCNGDLDGEVRAKRTVIAAGVWNNQLLEPIGIDGRVKAKKRQLFTVSAKRSSELEKLLHVQGFKNGDVLPFVILPRYGCYVKSVEENEEFWVGCEDDFNRPFINTPSDTLDDCRAEPAYFEHCVYPIIKEYLPEFEGSRPSQMWAGYYSYNTLDSVPFAFEESGLIIAGGGSGSGIMKGDAMGRIVDALYRLGENGVATLHGGANYSISRLSFSHRSVEREEWVI